VTDRSPREAQRGDRLYAVVRGLARFWVWFLFKRADVRHPERVPATGPVLLCINHPNNLIDSLLVGATLERKVHYLATATLFRNPLLRRFLLACGAIPVYRKGEEPLRATTRPPATTDRNADVFAACHQAFDEGRLIAIYPEGTTHAETRVQRIRTGAARIALGYEAEHPDTLRMIPVGLSFEARKAFTGRVLISFGEPIPITPYLAAYAQDPVKAVDALTTAIQWAMEAEVVHVERIDSEALVHEVEALYREDLVRELHEERGLADSQIDRFRLSRTIVDAVNHFKAHEPERVERLWRRILGYRTLLAAYRVKDEAVQDRLQHSPVRQKIQQSWVAILGFPVFAYGAAVNALPYLLPRWLAHARARKETDYATTRLLASVVAVPLFWGLEIWLVARLAGRLWATLFALSLPVSGLLAYQYLRGLGRLRGGLRLTMLAATRAQDAQALVTEREAIIAALDQAKRDYLAATRGSSF
jgi:glycerol-3-phosphate O-acyltransferase/dihydroxyacetone phosphate acyltransferase